MTPWEKFLEFLTSVGVDTMTAMEAEVHISAGVDGGTITVTAVSTDENGVKILEGEGDEAHLATTVEEYEFARPQR